MRFLYRGLAFFIMLCLHASGWAQMPENVRVLKQKFFAEERKQLECNDAGTIQNPMFIGNAQSNDPQFLCFGDSIQVMHNGDFDLSGDPDPATAPGVGYAIYSCPPSIEGMDIATILTDPCLVTDPMPPNDLWAFTDQPNGNAIFNNILFQPGNTTVMDFYNNGDPVLIYYAPITLDDFDNNNFENGGNCVDVSADQAFPLVYLNPVELRINEDMLDCNCEGVVELNFSGGLPEYNPTENYRLTVTEQNSGAPVVLGDNVAPGNTYRFDIPGIGDYEILVEDGVSCEYFSVESFCQGAEIDLELPEEEANTGDIVCLPLTVKCLDNTVLFQFNMQFDDSVLRLDTIFSDVLTIRQGANYNLFAPGEVIVTWDSPTLNPIPLMDGDTLLYLCFEVIGTSGGSDVTIFDAEFSSSDGMGGFNDFLDGSINVNPGRINVSGQSLQITDTLIQDIITCPGDTTGSINITVSGGTPPYRYLWQTPFGSSREEDLMNIPAGNYSVTILDSEVPPNELIANFVVNAPSDFMIDLEGIDPLCFDSLNGCLIVNSVTGGTPPYSWTWRDASNNVVGIPNEDTICGVGRGLYNLVLTDANGCQVEESLVLQVDPITALLDMDESNLRESCDPGMDGRLVLNISGGDISQSGQYGINWSSGETDVTEVSNLSSGNYSVTITDDNGCTLVRSALFISPARAPFITTFDSVSISCPGGTDGVLIARFDSPGSPISGIEWSTGDTAGPGTFVDSITGLSSGWYYVTVTAEDGCEGVDSAFLGEPQGIEYDIEIMNPECFGYSTGSIRIIPRPNTDTSNIIVEWSNDESGYFIDSLSSGNYTAYFRDTLNGCTIDSFTQFLLAPAGMSFNFSNTAPTSCFDECDGRATLTVSGGNAPGNLYDIRWNDNTQVDGNTNISTNIMLCPGMNYVTVEDEAGCIQTDSVEISSPPELLVSQDTLIMPNCRGFSDGEIRLSIEGGQAPYTVTWFDGTTEITKDSLPAGSYMVTVEDDNGCTESGTFRLAEPDSFEVRVDINNSNLALDCTGDADGRIITATTAINTDGFTYEWSPNVSSGSEASNLSAGSYGITVTTRNGCVDSTRANVSGVPEIEYFLSGIDQPACFGQPSTFTVSNALGGNGAPYTYKILEEGLELNIGDSVSLFAGTYTLALVDRDGCETDSVIVIGQPQELLVNIPHDTIIRGQELLLAEMGEDKSIVVQYTPLTTQLGTINWTLEDPSGPSRYNQDSSRITTQFLNSQLVSVKVTDENGCMGTDEMFIRVDRDRNVFIPNAFSPNADNSNDLFAVYTGTGVLNIKSFRVFSRWGEQVYFVENIDPLVFNSNAVGWDGRFDGKELNPGVFVYLIEVEFIDGEVLLYRGDVTLVK